MKKFVLLILLIFVVSTMYGQAKMAKVNETVWLVVYKVKADKRKQYEHFVHDIFGMESPNYLQLIKKFFVKHASCILKNQKRWYLFVLIFDGSSD